MQSCASKMMDLLCKQYSTDLNALDMEIEKLYDENGSITSNKLFVTRETTLKADLENYVSTLLKNEEKKCVRDKLSYDNAQAYN